MSAVAVKKEVSTKWITEFEATAANRLGATSPSVKEVQEKAIHDFATRGIPDKKVEDYKYTNIRLYLNDEFLLKGEVPMLKKSNISRLLIGDYITVVIINGRFVKELSLLEKLPKEITLRNLFTALKENKVAGISEGNGNPMALLNTALAQDGLFIHVPAGFNCSVPIHLLNVSTGLNKVLYNPRNVIQVEEGASLTLIESFHSFGLEEKVFTNLFTEVAVEKEATLNSYVFQEEETLAGRSNFQQVSVGAESHFNSTVITLDGKMVRNDLNISINGKNAEIHMHGLSVVKDGHHIDNHTLVEHNVPNCFSNELYKNVIANSGTGVFNGKIFVKQDAQKTNAYQSNKNILLGDDASMNTKPQLEIYADDVKCSHGTTTGRLDETALFYLQSRGLNENLARKVLLGAFAKEVSDTVKDETFRDYLEQRIHDHIA